MTPQQLADACAEAIALQAKGGTPRDRAQIALTTQPNWMMPPGFPRGIIVHQKPDGTAVRYLPAARILAYLDTHGFERADLPQ